MIDLESLFAEHHKKGYELATAREIKSGKEAILFLVNWDRKSVALNLDY